jgi:hypothetical protein
MPTPSRTSGFSCSRVELPLLTHMHCRNTSDMPAQLPAGPPRLAAAPVCRFRFALTPLALNLLVRGLLPCMRTRLRNRAEPATGRTLPLAPADAPVQFRANLRVLQLRRPFHLLRRHLLAAKSASAALLLPCACFCGTHVRSLLHLLRAAPARPRSYSSSSSSCCRTRARPGLAAPQVPPRPPASSYRRARLRCPPCGSAPSCRTSAPSAHARATCALGPRRPCAAAALLLLARRHAVPTAPPVPTHHRSFGAAYSSAPAPCACTASRSPARSSAPAPAPACTALRSRACAARAHAPSRRHCRSGPPARPASARLPCAGARCRPPRTARPPPGSDPRRAEGRRQGKIPQEEVPAKNERGRETPGRRRTEREEKKRRRRKGISQGLVHKFRKLQGPFCKA